MPAGAVETVLTDARVYMPGGELIDGWLAIDQGLVHSIGMTSPPPAHTYLSCKGALVLPGLIDIHVHFRDPGHTYKEDFLTGSAAAAFGGVTTVLDMPNTEGFVVTPDDLRRKIQAIEGRSFVDFGFYALLRDSSAHVRELRDLGVAGLKWLLGYHMLDGELIRPSSNAELLATVRAAADADLLVGVHAESYEWLRDLTGTLRQSGRRDAEAHELSRPAFVEGIGVAEAAILAAEAGCRLHVHHLSSATGLDVATRLKAALPTQLTIETCPQYLLLDDSDVRALGTRTKCNPPIRYAADSRQLLAGLVDGRIDCVATDHAPHSLEEQETDSIWEAASGLLGVETLFNLVFDLVADGRLTLSRFVEVVSERPAEIIRLDDRKGRLQPGKHADLIVVDPQREVILSEDHLHSKHPVSVYDGRRCRGAIRSVFVRGRQVVANGQLVGTPAGAYTPSFVGTRQALKSTEALRI